MQMRSAVVSPSFAISTSFATSSGAFCSSMPRSSVRLSLCPWAVLPDFRIGPVQIAP